MIGDGVGHDVAWQGVEERRMSCRGRDWVMESYREVPEAEHQQPLTFLCTGPWIEQQRAGAACMHAHMCIY